MVRGKYLDILNLNYQDNLTNLGIVMTVGVSLIVAAIFYEITVFPNQENKEAITWIVVCAVMVILLAMIYYSLNRKKSDIRSEIVRELGYSTEKEDPKIISNHEYNESSGVIILSDHKNHE